MLSELLFPEQTRVNFIDYLSLFSDCGSHLFFWSAILDKLLGLGLIRPDLWAVIVYSEHTLAGSVNILSNGSAHSHADYVN